MKKMLIGDKWQRSSIGWSRITNPSTDSYNFETPLVYRQVIENEYQNIIEIVEFESFEMMYKFVDSPQNIVKNNRKHRKIWEPYSGVLGPGAWILHEHTLEWNRFPINYEKLPIPEWVDSQN